MEMLETHTIRQLNDLWQEMITTLKSKDLFLASELVGIEKDKIIIATPIEEMFRINKDYEEKMFDELRKRFEKCVGEGVRIEIRKAKKPYLDFFSFDVKAGYSVMK